MKEKLKKVFELFLSFFKIGLFTFGGGYAMIPLIENEVVEKKKWLQQDELLDIIAVAESTPGPIAINSATYVGFRRAGVLGSVFATLGVVLPSFIIISVIALFLEKFLEIELVAMAFKGIQAAVAVLIIRAAIKMIKKRDKKTWQIILLIAVFLLSIAIDIFDLSFSSIYLILSGGILGVVIYFVCLKKEPKGVAEISVDKTADTETEDAQIQEENKKEDEV